MVAMVGKSVAVVETMAIVGVAVVVVSIGISFRSSGSSGLGISGPLAVVVPVETAIGESVEGTSVDGGHNGGSGHSKRVAKVATIVGISIGSGLGISRPLAIVVSKVVAVAVAMGIVGVSISISLSCHGSKEAQSSNGHGFHHD